MPPLLTLGQVLGESGNDLAALGAFDVRVSEKRGVDSPHRSPAVDRVGKRRVQVVGLRVWEIVISPPSLPLPPGVAFVRAGPTGGHSQPEPQTDQNDSEQLPNQQIPQITEPGSWTNASPRCRPSEHIGSSLPRQASAKTGASGEIRLTRLDSTGDRAQPRLGQLPYDPVL